MQATQPIRIINTQYGTDDAQNPWCVVQETTHQDYYDNASVRRICTVNSILTRRSLGHTTPTAPPLVIVQETNENRELPPPSTDDGKKISSKKSQKKEAKSRTRRRKFFRTLLCCSGGGEPDDDVYGTRPVIEPCSVKKSVVQDNVHDQDRSSENERSPTSATPYVPATNEWVVIPESETVEYSRQTASSGEYGATVSQAVRRQSVVTTAEDSSVIQVHREQRHYECTLARVSEETDHDSHRRGGVRSSVVVRELSPTNTRILQRAIMENTAEALPTASINLPSGENSDRTVRPKKRVSFGSQPTLSSTSHRSLQRLSEGCSRGISGIQELSPTNTHVPHTAFEENIEQIEAQSQRRHKSVSSKKRVSFGSQPTLSGTSHRQLQSIGEDCSTYSSLSALSSLSSDNNIHQHQDEEYSSASVKNKHVNISTPENLNIKKDVTLKSALKVRSGAAALNTCNGVKSKPNIDLPGRSKSLEKMKANLVVKRRSDGSRYVAMKSYNTCDHRSGENAEVSTRSELHGEVKEETTWVLETPRLSKKFSSHEAKSSTSSVKPPRKPKIMEDDSSKRSCSYASFSVDNIDCEVILSEGSQNTAKLNMNTNIDPKHDVTNKSILKVRGDANDVIKSRDSVIQETINRDESEEKEWVVKRRSDGSRYVTKISSNNNSNTLRRRSADHTHALLRLSTGNDDNRAQSDVMLSQENKEPGQRRELHRSGICENNPVELSQDERNQSSPVSKSTVEQRKFSAIDPSISREKRQRLVLHRDLDLSSATLLAVL